MHFRRIASFVLGVWLGGTLLMALIALQSLDTSDDILSSQPPEFRKLTEPLGPEKTRVLLNYEGNEQTWRYLQTWGLAQLFIGPALAGLLYLSGRMNRLAVAVCISMVLLAAFAHFIVRPAFAYAGRNLHFTYAGRGDRVRFYVLGGLYWGMDGLKVALGLGLAAYLFTLKGRSRSSADDLGELPSPPLPGQGISAMLRRPSAVKTNSDDEEDEEPRAAKPARAQKLRLPLLERVRRRRLMRRSRPW